MKKFTAVILCITIITLLFTWCVFAVDNDSSPMSLTVEKYTDEMMGVVYTTKPFTIKAVYDNGTANTNDKFTKKSWLRVDTLDADTDLTEVYNQNKDRENIIQTRPSYMAKTWRTNFKLDVTLNGTYIFCGWSGYTEGLPDFIERVDITGIELERPMAWLEGYVTGDFSSDVIANVVVKNIECGKDAEIKRYAFVKDYDLPPGSWPESLPPEYCNEYFDSEIADLYDKFIEGGLYLGYEVFSNEGSKIIPENNVYPIRDVGGYILFIEDTNGIYSHIDCCINPALKRETPPEINTEVVESDESKATVKVDVKSEYDLARLDYAVLSPQNMQASVNGTDEYFLEKEKYKIIGNTIELSGAAVICAMDNQGNASYKRVDIGGEPEPTATPEIAETPIPDETASPQPTTAPDEYLYEISELSILTQSGEELDTPPENGSFEAEVTVKKLRAESSKDYIFVAVYNEDGILLNIDYVRADFAPDYDCSFGFNIPAQAQKVGSIKAFAWSGFNSAKPLAQTKEINFQ